MKLGEIMEELSNKIHLLYQILLITSGLILTQSLLWGQNHKNESKTINKFEFLSEDWLKEAKKTAESDRDLIKESKEIEDLGIVIILESDKRFNKTCKVFLNVDKGSFKEVKLIDDEIQVNPKYIIRTKYSGGKRIFKGEVDPIYAFLIREIKVEKNVALFIQHADLIRKLIKVIGKVPTYYPDEYRVEENKGEKINGEVKKDE